MSDVEQESPRDLAAAYALGASNAEEARAFEAYLATSPEAQRDLAEYREVAALLALADPTDGSSHELRARVLANAPAQRSASVSPFVPRRPRWMMGALGAGLAASLVWGTSLALHQTRLDRELAARDSSLAGLQQQMAHREATLNGILEPDVELYQLTASGDPEPRIQLFWNRKQHTAILHAFQLKPPPPGRAYQLWFIKDGKPIPSITFRSEDSSHALVERINVPEDRGISAAAITEEPAGGSPQPTTTPIMVGALKS
jgi:anti-sigma-K factor RskA